MQNDLPKIPATEEGVIANRESNRLSNALHSSSVFDLRAILGMLARQWRLIFTVILLVMLLAVAILTQIRNRYTAEALLTIDERGSQLLGQEDALAMGATLNNQVDTEVEILGSTSVALAAIDRLALWRDGEFGFTGLSALDRLRGLIGISVAAPAAPAATRLGELPADSQAQLVKKLNNSVKITRRGLTNIISVQATSRDPAKSALIANSMAESYLDLQINSKINSAKQAADFLVGRVDQIAKNIQEVDSKIESFILAQSETIGTPEARAELTRMRDEMDSLTSTQTSFASELARLQSIQDNPSAAEPSSVSAELRALAEKRLELAQQLSAAASSPAIQKQLQTLDQQLIDAAKLRSDSVREELAKSDKQKTELGKQLQDLFAKQKIPNEVAVDLYRLQREAESDRKLYDSYSTRLGEVQQQVSLALPNTRIVSPAIVPHDPSYPPSLLMMALSSLLGLGLGTAAAIAREHLVGGFASAAQVEAVTGLEVMATIPSYDEKDPHSAILNAPFSGFSESVRRLRIGVENALAQLNSKTILVTSTEPSEGKSTLAISLARALAAAGRSTILIDADFRHPSIDKLIGDKSRADLMELLPNITPELDIESYVKVEKATGMRILTTTPTKKLVSDVLVGSSNFLQLLQLANAKYEWVIIDCPPIGYVVDAKIISRYSDVVLYVVKQNSTSQRDAVSGMRQIVSDTGYPPISIVLNNAHDLLGGHYYRNSRYNDYYKPAT